MSNVQATIVQQSSPELPQMPSANDGETRILPGAAESVTVELIPGYASSSKTGALESSIVEHLPIWISRETGPLSEYSEQFPAEVKFLSRQHAYLYYEDGQVYLKDLGSANGTELNGQRIEAQMPVPLYDGDYVVFGCPFFNFRIKLENRSSDQTSSHQSTDQITENAAEDVESKPNRTVSIDAAKYFLKIFCDEKTPDTSSQPQPVEPHTSKANAAGQRKHRPLRKINAFSRELKDALAEEQRPRRRRRNGLIAAIVSLSLIALGVTIYWQNAVKWEVEKLLKQKQYQASLALAKDHLQKSPDDIYLADLFNQTLIKMTVPEWTRKLDGMMFDAADTMLNDAVKYRAATEEASQILNLLQWANDLERFASERGGMANPLQMFKHEETITSLLKRWDQNANQRELLLLKITHHVPTFTSVRSRIISHLTELRNEKSVHLKAIAELKTIGLRLCISG